MTWVLVLLVLASPERVAPVAEFDDPAECWRVIREAGVPAACIPVEVPHG